MRNVVIELRDSFLISVSEEEFCTDKIFTSNLISFYFRCIMWVHNKIFAYHNICNQKGSRAFYEKNRISKFWFLDESRGL